MTWVANIYCRKLASWHAATGTTLFKQITKYWHNIVNIDISSSWHKESIPDAKFVPWHAQRVHWHYMPRGFHLCITLRASSRINSQFHYIDGLIREVSIIRTKCTRIRSVLNRIQGWQTWETGLSGALYLYCCVIVFYSYNVWILHLISLNILLLTNISYVPPLSLWYVY